MGTKAITDMVIKTTMTSSYGNDFPISLSFNNALSYTTSNLHKTF